MIDYTYEASNEFGSSTILRPGWAEGLDKNIPQFIRDPAGLSRDELASWHAGFSGAIGPRRRYPYLHLQVGIFGDDDLYSGVAG